MMLSRSCRLRANNSCEVVESLIFSLMAVRKRRFDGLCCAVSSQYPDNYSWSPPENTPMIRLSLAVLFFCVLGAAWVRADAPAEQSVEQIAERCRKSVVVITSEG